jgi:SMC interacting uncharacterized protein involved in chromosome segregation
MIKRQKSKAKIQRLQMKLMKVENEIEDVRAHSIDLRAQMQIIDNEYGF